MSSKVNKINLPKLPKLIPRFKRSVVVDRNGKARYCRKLIKMSPPNLNDSDSDSSESSFVDVEGVSDCKDSDSAKSPPRVIVNQKNMTDSDSGESSSVDVEGDSKDSDRVRSASIYSAETVIDVRDTDDNIYNNQRSPSPEVECIAEMGGNRSLPQHCSYIDISDDSPRPSSPEVEYIATVYGNKSPLPGCSYSNTDTPRSPSPEAEVENQPQPGCSYSNTDTPRSPSPEAEVENPPQPGCSYSNTEYSPRSPSPDAEAENNLPQPRNVNLTTDLILIVAEGTCEILGYMPENCIHQAVQGCCEDCVHLFQRKPTSDKKMFKRNQTFCEGCEVTFYLNRRKKNRPRWHYCESYDKILCPACSRRMKCSCNFK